MSAIEIIFLILSLGAIAFCVYWVKTDSSNRFKAVFSLIGTTFFFCCLLFEITFSNGILWFGQHHNNASIDININSNVVEKTSFLYILQQFDANATVDDVIRVMGNDFEEDMEVGYQMIYRTSQYTIQEYKPSIIRFKFNSRKTKIISITWGYASPSDSQFNDTLQYLEENAFGKAQSVFSGKIKKADWTGLHLEDTNYYLLLQRLY